MDTLSRKAAGWTKEQHEACEVAFAQLVSAHRALALLTAEHHEAYAAVRRLAVQMNDAAERIREQKDVVERVAHRISAEQVHFRHD